MELSRLQESSKLNNNKIILKFKNYMYDKTRKNHD
jgi:hypothetical protein